MREYSPKLRTNYHIGDPTSTMYSMDLYILYAKIERESKP